MCFDNRDIPNVLPHFVSTDNQSLPTSSSGNSKHLDVKEAGTHTVKRPSNIFKGVQESVLENLSLWVLMGSRPCCGSELDEVEDQREVI